MTSRNLLTVRQNFRSGIKIPDLLEQPVALFRIRGLHGFFHSWHQSGTCTQLIYPEREKERRQSNLSRHLSANADPDAVGVSRLYRHLDQTQNRWMRRFIQVCDALIYPIHSD